MCGIAGAIDLSGQGRPVPAGMLRRMAGAIVHRGPDEDGFLERPGLGFASRRLSIVGLLDGRQPIFNEDGSVAVVFNGELFDYPERRAELAQRGHKLVTHCDTEVLPHLWEEKGEDFFAQLQGQFAFALYDERQRRLVLGRDRFGICPLYHARVDDWLLFGSEVKALLASGMVEPRADPAGIHELFTFFAMPGPATCFAGVYYLPPGRYLRIQLGAAGQPATVSEHTYWRLEFPDRGQEDRRPLPVLVDEFERLLLDAVTKRLRADVPVVSYLSGGVDSSIVVAMATKVRRQEGGQAIPTFTIRIQRPDLDETKQAAIVSRHLGADPIVVDCGANEVLCTYPELVRAAEAPVIDTSCAALLLLARRVHQEGYKVALTGEGSDEWLAGYPWHKVYRALSWLDVVPGLPVGLWLRRALAGVAGVGSLWATNRVAQRVAGGHNGWIDMYSLMGLAKARLFSRDLLAAVPPGRAWEELDLEPARMKRWHPLDRELAVSARAHLVGLLLNVKGDRVAMHSSVETRYPFLDEAVCDFLARVPARYKLRGLLGDKYLLRKVAERWLPREIAWRQKAMFRAPFDSFHLETAPPFVEQLLSPESLRRTGYFDPEAVRKAREGVRERRLVGLRRIGMEMGLVGVLSTQLWHHTYLGGGLCALPAWQSEGERGDVSPVVGPHTPADVPAKVGFAGGGLVAGPGR